MFGDGLIGEEAVHENEGEQQQVEEDAELTPRAHEPPGEDHRVRAVANPCAPTTEEREKHALTHLPFRPSGVLGQVGVGYKSDISYYKSC